MVVNGNTKRWVCWKQTHLIYVRSTRRNRTLYPITIMGLLQLAVTWYMLEGKLPTGTSKTKKIQIYLASCKRPIISGTQLGSKTFATTSNKRMHFVINVPVEQRFWGGAVVEHSPPTNVARVRFPDSASYVG